MFTLFNKRIALPKGGRYSLKENNLLLKSILFLLKLDCYKKRVAKIKTRCSRLTRANSHDLRTYIAG